MKKSDLLRPYEVTFTCVWPPRRQPIVTYRINAVNRPSANRLGWKRFNLAFVGYFDGIRVYTTNLVDNTTGKP